MLYMLFDCELQNENNSNFSVAIRKKIFLCASDLAPVMWLECEVCTRPDRYNLEDFSFV